MRSSALKDSAASAGGIRIFNPIKSARETLSDPANRAGLLIVLYLAVLKWSLPHYVGTRSWTGNLLVILIAFITLPIPRLFRVFYSCFRLVYIPIYAAWALVYLTYYSPGKTAVAFAAASVVMLTAKTDRSPSCRRAAHVIFLGAAFAPLFIADMDTEIGFHVLLATAVSVGFALASHRLDIAKARPADFFVAVLMMLAMPSFTMEKFMPREALGVRLAQQPGVTRLFSPKLPKLPRAPMQLFDEDFGGRYFVTPHKSADHMTVIQPGGSAQIVKLGGRMPNHSEKRGPLIHTVIGDDLAVIDTRGWSVTKQMRLSPDAVQKDWHRNAGLFEMDASGERGYVSWDGGWSCTIADMKHWEVLARLPQTLAGACLPIDGDRRVLVTSLEWPGAGLATYDAREFRRLRSRKLAGVGFNLATYEPQSRRIFFFRITTGLVEALDAVTLETVDSTHLRPGVWGGLPDPDRPVVYAYDYFKGGVYALDARDLRVLGKVVLGPNLRVVTISADKKSLLAVTTAGGFRVDISALTESMK